MAKIVLIESKAFTVNPHEIIRSGGKYLVESSGGKMTVTLPMTKLNEKNLNGRTYSTFIMESAIRNAKKLFEGREMLSSVNEHPTEPYVTPGEASHVVTEAWVDGDMLYGKWEVLETHNGKNLRALVEAGVAFGVSIRGLGSMDNYGNILEDYELLGCDCVGEPSAQLRVRPQVVENLDKDGGNPDNKPTVKESKMANKDVNLKYLSEQRILMQNEAKGEDKLAVFQRAAVVEAAIAGSGLSGRDLVDVHNEWDKIKKESFALVTESNSAEDKAALQNESVELLKKLLEKRTAQVKAMASGLTQISEQLKGTKAVTQKALAETRSKADVARRVDETRAKRSNAVVGGLLKENQELLALATTNELKYRLSVKEAAMENKAYRLAVREAAGLAKRLAVVEAELAAVKVGGGSNPAAKPAVKEGAAPAAPAKPATKVLDNTKPPVARRLNESRSGKGEVRLAPGMDL